MRERAFRVGARLPSCVVAPTPWFPLQRLLRRFRPEARPGAPRYEQQQGFDVWYPRFLSLPLIGRRFDGFAMALAALPRLADLHRRGRLDVIDAHFGYPDGYAAALLGRWLNVPFTITLRGTEQRHAGDPVLRPLLVRALQRAARVVTVADSLRRLACSLGTEPTRVRLVGSGVDTVRFRPLERGAVREPLGLDPSAPVLISVGGLVERKGFHRVIECLPALRADRPGLQYLVLGGPSAEGDWTERLKSLVERLGLGDCVRLVGPVEPDALRTYLSAADVFVLATRNEGRANVFLEAMACGLPVVTTDVGGNSEIVCRTDLGRIVPFGHPAALEQALREALSTTWDRASIRRYAESHTWDRCVDALEQEFRSVAAGPRPVVQAS